MLDPHVVEDVVYDMFESDAAEGAFKLIPWPVIEVSDLRLHQLSSLVDYSFKFFVIFIEVASSEEDLLQSIFGLVLLRIVVGLSDDNFTRGTCK